MLCILNAKKKFSQSGKGGTNVCNFSSCYPKYGYTFLPTQCIDGVGR